MARAAKKVTGSDENVVTHVWPEVPPETRAEFIERIASAVVCNAHGWDAIKNGKVVATVAFNMATELANLLDKRDKGD